MLQFRPIKQQRRDHQREGWWKAHWAFAVLFAAPFLGGGGAWLWHQIPKQSGFASPIASEQYAKNFARCAGPVRITCVVDGDTLWLEGTKIRIADINAPEISHPLCPAEDALGQLATERLIALLNAGGFSLRSFERDEDVYGRKLRIVTRGGESLGEVLVAEGLAEKWTGSRRNWC